MTLAPLPVIGSTPDDSLLAALDSLPAQSDTGAVVEWAQTEPWLPNEPQTASESHWRVSAQIGPHTSLRSVGRILSRFWGAKAALARKRHHLGPSLRCNPLPVIEARFTDSRATGLPAASAGVRPYGEANDAADH
jgi:hypothetical protein